VGFDAFSSREPVSTSLENAMREAMKVYLAGPDVFLPDAVAIGRRKAEICARYGLTGLYPLDNAVDRAAAADVSLAIFKANEAMMDAADAIIANLTPFRGAGADPGTVYELGFMAGRGKLCLGYSNDPATYAERVRQFTLVQPHGGRLVDPDGLTVEDFGLNDNLMMIHALDRHGCALVTPRERPADIWHELAAFEACVRLASERRIAGRP
jgi:nucleoside 2-deoxyribosyltransferase